MFEVTITIDVLKGWGVSVKSEVLDLMEVEGKGKLIGYVRRRASDGARSIKELWRYEVGDESLRQACQEFRQEHPDMLPRATVQELAKPVLPRSYPIRDSRGMIIGRYRQ